MTTPAISFRDTLQGKIVDFARTEGVSCLSTVAAATQLVVNIGSYREEGVALFPQVFVCTDLRKLMGCLAALDAIALGAGPRTVQTAEAALKRCAPLAHSGWCVWLELGDNDTFNYGVFRAAVSPIAESPVDALGTVEHGSLSAFCIFQSAHQLVELRGCAGRALNIHISATPVEDGVRGRPLDEFVAAATRDVDATYREAVTTFVRRTMFTTLQHGHGALVAVLEAGQTYAPQFLADGVPIRPALDIAAQTATYIRTKSEDELHRLQGTATLLSGMLCSDGITLLSSDGKILAYNIFVHDEPGTQLSERERQQGGARRRAFSVLCEHVKRNSLRAAFYRSHDGKSDCEKAKQS